MTREERARLKEIEQELLPVSLLLDKLIRQRASIDPLGTVDFLEQFYKLLKGEVAAVVASSTGTKH